MVRAILILALAWQPLLPLGARAGATSVPECATISCCQTVERTTCCGERVLEHICGRTGGPCVCGLVPRGSEPMPAAPTPRTGDELTTVLLTAQPAVVEHVAEPACRLDAPVEPRAGLSHNQIQAFLGVWRT